jgi:large subunit ribosomal protein L9
MKIILLQDVRGVGRKYDVKEVADGYARNFLIPRRLAKPATDEALSELQAQRENLVKQLKIWQDKLKEIQKFFEEKPLVFKLKVGERGEVFGSVTKKEIEEALRKVLRETNKELLPEANRDFLIEVRLNKPLKTLGSHQVVIDLGRGVTGEIKVLVEKE